MLLLPKKSGFTERYSCLYSTSNKNKIPSIEHGKSVGLPDKYNGPGERKIFLTVRRASAILLALKKIQAKATSAKVIAISIVL